MSSHTKNLFQCRAFALTLTLIAALVFPLVSSVQAADQKITAPSSPVDVKVGAYLIDLTKINGAEQMFNADVVVRISWMDPRLVDTSKGTRTMSLDKVWHPKMAIANMRDVKTLLPDEVEVSPEGEVVFRQRIIGDYTARLDLKDFPNDEQSLGIHVVAGGYTPEQVRFVMDSQFTGRAEHLTISDWLIGKVEVRSESYVVPRLGEVAGARFEFTAERYLSYYGATIFASAAIIVCMAWLVFWMPPEAINPRISISVTSMLTLIAHRFVIGGELPRLSYLTQMDYFLLGSTFMVLMGLMGVVCVARVMSRGRPELGVRLNGIFRWVYPIVFLTMMGMLI